MQILPEQMSTQAENDRLLGSAISVTDDVLTWSPDSPRARRRGGNRSAPLPGTGPGAVTSILYASYVVGDGGVIGTRKQFEKMLFLDEGGSCLWASTTYFPGQLEDTWPQHSLADLEAFGIAVRRADFTNARALQKAHPGAAGAVQWSSNSLAWIPGLVLALLLIGLVLLAAQQGWLAGLGD